MKTCKCDTGVLVELYASLIVLWPDCWQSSAMRTPPLVKHGGAKLHVHTFGTHSMAVIISCFRRNDRQPPRCAEGLCGRGSGVSVRFVLLITGPEHRQRLRPTGRTQLRAYAELCSLRADIVLKTDEAAPPVMYTYHRLREAVRTRTGPCSNKSGSCVTQAESHWHPSSASPKAHAPIITAPALRLVALKQLSHLMVSSGHLRRPFCGMQRGNHLSDQPQETAGWNRVRNQNSWKPNSKCQACNYAEEKSSP